MATRFATLRPEKERSRNETANPGNNSLGKRNFASLRLIVINVTIAGNEVELEGR